MPANQVRLRQAAAEYPTAYSSAALATMKAQTRSTVNPYCRSRITNAYIAVAPTMTVSGTTTLKDCAIHLG